MKGFILRSDDETIAVIPLSTKKEFDETVRLAIAEHYISDVKDVEIIEYEGHPIGLSSQSFEASSIEDGENSLRVYYLQETYIYL